MEVDVSQHGVACDPDVLQVYYKTLKGRYAQNLFLESNQYCHSEVENEELVSLKEEDFP